MKAPADPRLAAIWKTTHRDFKSLLPSADGATRVRTIMVNRGGGCTIVPLEDLTEAEIVGLYRRRCED